MSFDETREPEPDACTLKRLVEHPNADTGNRLYLDELERAAEMLERASRLAGFGEYAYGTAQMLRQFHARLLKELLVEEGRKG